MPGIIMTKSVALSVETFVYSMLGDYTAKILDSLSESLNSHVPEEDRILDITDISREVHEITTVGVPVVNTMFESIRFYWQLGYHEEKVKLIFVVMQRLEGEYDNAWDGWELELSAVAELDEEDLIGSFKSSVKNFMYSFFSEVIDK